MYARTRCLLSALLTCLPAAQVCDESKVWKPKQRQYPNMNANYYGGAGAAGYGGQAGYPQQQQQYYNDDGAGGFNNKAPLNNNGMVIGVQPAAPPVAQPEPVANLSQGDRCKVYFIKYRRWYPGSVEELRYARDGTGKYVVAFDDGDRGQYKMDLGQVKPLLTMLPPDGARYTEGQPLQVVLERQWHPCVVVAVNAVSAQKHFKPNGREAHFGSYKVSRWVGW